MATATLGSTDADPLKYLNQVFDWMLGEREKVRYLPTPEPNADGTNQIRGVADGLVCQVVLTAVGELSRRSSN